MKNITYIFTENRKSNYYNETIQAREFYYGLTSFNKSEYNIEIIEFDYTKKLINFPLRILDEFIRRFLSLPFYSAQLFSFKNIKILSKTDHLIMVPESSGCSSLILLIFFKKLFNFKAHLFVMGLYSKKIRFKQFTKLHFFIIKVLVKLLDNVFFLGKSELSKAINIHKKQNKLNYFPFSIDTSFWDTNKIDLEKNLQIIFVGNDGNRNEDLLIEIATKLDKYNFTFVSQLPRLKNLNLPNVDVISGKWGDENLDDNALKEIYLNSRLCILPLKNSTQPSGQSVSLQCMSLGIPVMISKTDGFWDPDKFVDESNILMIENNTKEWVKNIESSFSNLNKLNSISQEAKKTVKDDFNLNEFYKRLIEFIG